MQNIRLDAGAAALLARLHGAGYAAYAVGGCVRDSLLGRTPQDWDLCTSARPEQVLALFGEGQCIPTGLQHGTVTIKYGGQLYETTTFRTEGAYTDGRHPDEVHFVPDVREDLARRDFTINAMAYNDAEGLIDPFGGQQDLQQGILRAVGDPATRFEEDALRILRLYRFAARFGFAIDPPTGQAARALCAHLDCVSVERIEEELSKLLAAPAPAAYLDEKSTKSYYSGAFRPGIAGRKAGGGCLPGGHGGSARAVGRIADEPWRGRHPQGPETPALLQHLHRADGGAGERGPSGSFLFGHESGHSIPRPTACGSRVPPSGRSSGETPGRASDKLPLSPIRSSASGNCWAGTTCTPCSGWRRWALPWSRNGRLILLRRQNWPHSWTPTACAAGSASWP